MPRTLKTPENRAADAPSLKWRLQAAALALGLLLLGAFLWVPVLLPFFGALALAYAFDPLAGALERRGWSRSLSALSLMLLLVVVLSLLTLFVLPSLLRDARSFVAGLPDDIGIALGRARQLGLRFGLQLPEGDALVASLRDRLQEHQAAFMGTGMDLAKTFFAGLGNALQAVLGLLLVPVFFFLLLRDLPIIRAKALQLAPARHQALVANGYAQLDRIFSSYIRGQMILACILGLALATGLTLLGVKFGVLIGLLAGFLNLVPYVGQIVGVALALTMGLVDFQGWWHLAAIPMLFALMNFLEGSFITPYVVGKRVGLNPVETLLALLLGAQLAGLAGLVIVVPVAGALKLLLLDWVEDYKASKFYRGRAS